MFSLLVIFSLTIPISNSSAAELIPIPAGASDSTVCGLVERAHAKGITLWRGDDLFGALDLFKECESILKKRAMWTPSKLPEKSTAARLRAHVLTNSVVFSLAAIHQKMGHRSEADRYARMARERGILPKVVMSGQRGTP